jgi:hypothetical protein
MKERREIFKRVRTLPKRTVCVILLTFLFLTHLFSCSLLRKGEKAKEERRPGQGEDGERGRPVEEKEEKPGEPVEDVRREESESSKSPVRGGDLEALRRQKTIQHLDRKDYSLALDVINQGKREGLETEYCAAINGLIARGEESTEKENYEEAGVTFRKVLENYPAKESLQVRIARSRKWVETWIGIFSEKLMIRGLSAYRDGKLSAAVETWKKILRFNPSFQPAKKAIETTGVQMKNLKSIPESTK